MENFEKLAHINGVELPLANNSVHNVTIDLW